MARESVSLKFNMELDPEDIAKELGLAISPYTQRLTEQGREVGEFIPGDRYFSMIFPTENAHLIQMAKELGPVHISE